MTAFFQKISFDKIFKITLLVLISYFLFLLTNIANRTKKEGDVGRFQLLLRDDLIFDTKTGESIKFKYPN